MSYRQRQQSWLTSWRHPPLRLFLALGFASLLVATYILLAFNMGLMSGCVFTSVSSSCTPPSHSTPMLTTTHVVLPTATSPAIRTPIPTFSPTVSPPGSPAPPSPVLTDEEKVVNLAKHYDDLVRVRGSESDLHKAYNLLSPKLRDNMTFEEFKKNENYSLPKGCWQGGTIVSVTQRDNITWDVGMEVTQVSCVDGTTQVTYSWHFRVSLANGYAEIISIGLYPTGTGQEW